MLELSYKGRERIVRGGRLCVLLQEVRAGFWVGWHLSRELEEVRARVLQSRHPPLIWSHSPGPEGG